MKITLRALTQDQVSVIMRGLTKLPIEDALSTYAALNQQVQDQVAKAQARKAASAAKA